MLLNNAASSERENRKIERKKTTKRTMTLLSMISAPVDYSFFRPPRRTDSFYVLGVGSALHLLRFIFSRTVELIKDRNQSTE